MLNYPDIDPVIFRIGPLAVRWYGLMYLAGFGAAWLLIRRLAARKSLPLSRDDLSDLLFYAVIGVILGGRLGYVLFYNPAHFLSHPLDIPAVWQGGMSFHGGLLGVVLASLIFCRRRNLPVLKLGDVIANSATIGLGLGRLGNFINGELWGRTTDVPWGMVFPQAGLLPRHPSQLYEFLLEGVVLFCLLLWLNLRGARAGVPLFAFFACYGLFRFLVEFVREPDPQLGFLWFGATLGQLLSLPMILLGTTGLWFVLRGRADR
ncbi:MAG: prolipoprotein diacylglyceryl transferase [Geothermobacteraceae bacterium]